MAKIIGYILALVGLAGVTAYTFPEISSKIPITVNPAILIGASIVLLLLGIFMVVGKGGRGKQAPEVPIFQGKNVVGYRRR